MVYLILRLIILLFSYDNRRKCSVVVGDCFGVLVFNCTFLLCIFWYEYSHWFLLKRIHLLPDYMMYWSISYFIVTDHCALSVNGEYSI